ncbi:uncharacterized protein LOC106460726 [Limulus polyphemus]|uniref:Uncharacterized protein LOC106460726 n=1 Tax=Limulus polyphemus TaxID=6850 RepID=A0ABM1SF18_LIMPO|nr:uncharacterized protein LOC106460726 [Limulus polyphemus]
MAFRLITSVLILCAVCFSISYGSRCPLGFEFLYPSNGAKRYTDFGVIDQAEVYHIPYCVRMGSDQATWFDAQAECETYNSFLPYSYDFIIDSNLKIFLLKQDYVVDLSLAKLEPKTKLSCRCEMSVKLELLRASQTTYGYMYKRKQNFTSGYQFPKDFLLQVSTIHGSLTKCDSLRKCFFNLCVGLKDLLLNLSSDSSVFVTDYIWDEENKDIHKCVALKVHKSTVITYNCHENIKLPFVCVSPTFWKVEELYDTPFCRSGEKFSYLANGCLKIESETRKTYHDAMDSCIKLYKGNIIENELFSELVNTRIVLDGDFWVKSTENVRGLCSAYVGNKKEMFENCELKHGYICISSALKMDMKVFIQPNSKTHLLEMPSFFKNEISNKHLTCEMTPKYNNVSYMWVKNGIYLSSSKQSIFPTNIIDYTKWFGTTNTKQGEYECGVWFPGCLKPVMSSPVSVYFSDLISLMMKIQGTTFSLHFGSKYFPRNLRDFFKTTMELLIEGLKDYLPNPTWDFVNFKRAPDSGGIVCGMHIFMNSTETSRSKMTKDDILKDIKSRALKLFYTKTFSNVSVEVNILDFCDKQVKQIRGQNVTWNETRHTKFAVSDPYCLNESWQLVLRACESSFVRGSRWSDFDSSQCARLQDHITEESDSPSCRLGYMYKNVSGSLLCMREVQDPVTWSEAQNECQKDFAYLLTPDMLDPLLQLSDKKQKIDELKKVFGNFGKYWIGIQSIDNVLHYIGFHPKPLNLTKEKFTGRWESDTSSIDKVCFNTNIDLKITSSVCEKKLPFICVHKPFNPKFKPLPVCPSKWVMSFVHDACFFIDEWRKATWDEAQQNCKGGHLLTLADLLKYKLILKYLKEKYFSKRKISKEFWMGLMWRDKTYKWEDEKNNSVTYVHWKSTTDFSKTAGVLALNFGKVKSEGNWDLADPKLTKLYICERQAKRQTTAWAEVLVLNQYLSLLSDRSSQIPFLKCQTENSLPNSIVWYFDEVVVKGHRYSLIDNDDLRLTVREVLRRHPLQRQENDVLKVQGYYECETEQMRPFQTVKSFKRFFQFDGFWVLAASFVYVENHTLGNVYNKNYKNYWDELINTENLLNKCFSNNMERFHFVYHVRKLSWDTNSTKVIFNIYGRKSTTISEETASGEEKTVMIVKNLLQNRECEYLKIRKDSVIVRSTLRCFQDVTFDTVSGTNLTWPHTQVGASVIPKEPCIEKNGDPVVRKCKGDFIVGASWRPVDGSCRGTLSKVSLALNDLSQVEVKKDNAFNVSSNMKNLTENHTIFQALDVYYVARIMEKISFINTVNVSTLHSIVHATDNILEIEESILESSQRKINATSMIVYALEKMLNRTQANVSLSLKQVAVSRSVNHQFQPAEEIQVGIQLFSISSAKYKNSLQPVKYRDEFPALDIIAGIDITPAIIQNHRLSKKFGTTVSLKFTVYKNGKLFSSSCSTCKGNAVGPVIGGNIEIGPIYDLDDPIRIVFNLSEEFNTIDKKTLQCVYWDQRSNDNSGSWSTKGCQLGEKKSNILTCLCDHLTHFGVIFMESVDPDSSFEKEHQTALKIITYFGCSLSIFGLALTILTFIVFRKWRKGIGHQTLCNLAAALLGSLVIFLIGINKKHGQGLCMLSAVLLHYFLMVSFGWMLVEAVLQYLRFVKVVGTYIPRFMCKAMICAWGIPLLIVSLVFIIDYKQYYYGKTICWLAPYGFYIAFIIPVGIVVVVSLVVFNIVIYSIFCGQQSELRTNQSERKIAVAKLRAALCILILLGATWMFGLLSVMYKTSETLLVFQYLFTLTTTIQGFFIFFFHVFQEKSARELWNHFLQKKPHSSNTSTNALNLSRIN